MNFQIDPLLASFTRRMPRLKGTWRIRAALRNHFVQHYANRSDSWTIIGDFDGTLKMRLDRASYLGSAIYWFGAQDPALHRTLTGFLKPTMTFVDIGANQGEYTLVAAKRLVNGRVIAIEPMPNVRQALETNVKLNHFSHVQIYPFALSDTPGQHEMYMADSAQSPELANNEGLYSLYASSMRSQVTEKVDVWTLDHLIAQATPSRIDLIKIDVEGAELAVLRGATDTLTRYKPTLVLEVNDQALQAGGNDKGSLYEFLSQAGYNISLINSDGTVSAITSGSALPDYCDVICSPTR